MGRPPRHPRHPRRAVPDPPGPGPDLSSKPAPGAVESANIWRHPAVYETENHAADPEGRIEDAMRAVAGWAGRHLLDLGCGTGFHLPRWAREAERVTGVEPHPGLLSVARRRTRAVRTPAGHPVDLRVGTAQQIPLPDASVDVVQARWAYFFGPGCEPGLAELDRVVRRGGTAFVIDNDASRSTFGGWFRRGFPQIDPDTVERFWSRAGWQRTPIEMGWRFARREDFEAVVRIEFPPQVAAEVIAEHDGCEVDYAVNLWWRHY